MEPTLWDQLINKIAQLSHGVSPSALRDSFMNPPSQMFVNFLAEDITEDITGTERSHIVEVIAKALLNPVLIDWDIEEYIKLASHSRSRLPRPALGHISVPATILDKRGRIILWYLPGILLPSRQEDVLRATIPIAETMAKNVKDPVPFKNNKGATKSDGQVARKLKHPSQTKNKGCQNRKTKSNCKINWRVDRRYFATPNESRKFPPGVDTYSAGWFAQGHGSDRFSINPSRSLHSEAADRWLDASATLQIFGNNILSLIHPGLYEGAMNTLSHLRHEASTAWAANRWRSAFTGIAVISNRRTIPHLDRLGSKSWYDILFGSGSYDQARLILSEIGLSLEYSTGTAVALCGNCLRHEVREWGDGDRICYAMFMRHEVLKRYGSHYVGWSTSDTYLGK